MIITLVFLAALILCLVWLFGYSQLSTGWKIFVCAAVFFDLCLLYDKSYIQLIELTVEVSLIVWIFNYSQMQKKWKFIICALSLIAFFFIDGQYSRWRSKHIFETMAEARKELPDSAELKVGQIHHVSHSDGTLDIEIIAIDTIPMPDDAVNVILEFEIYNKSNEYFSPAEIYLQPADKYGDTYGSRHNAQGSFYDPDFDEFVDMNQARAAMMLDGNPLAAMPHKHYQDQLSFFVNRGKNAVVFGNTIIGYITLDTSEAHDKNINDCDDDENQERNNAYQDTNDGDSRDNDYSSKMPKDYIDLNTIFESNGEVDWNKFRLDEFDETQRKYLEQEGIYYDSKKACWRKKK